MTTWQPWAPSAAPTPGPGPTLWRWPKLRSPGLQNYRDVVVAVPPGHDRSDARYPVVYMQDGQNLFDPATSYAGDWDLLATLAGWSRRGLDAIVVGISNRGRFRRFEYSPFRDPEHGGGDGELYLGFLVDTVKPLVDASFRTRPEPGATAVAGSSLGGLVSLYALFRRPDVFGAAAGLSPSAWFADEALLAAAVPPGPPPRRLYLDAGTAEDATLVASVRRLRDRLAALGWSAAVGLRYREVAEGAHHESDWGRRFRGALPFLLGAADPSDDDTGAEGAGSMA